MYLSCINNGILSIILVLCGTMKGTDIFWKEIAGEMTGSIINSPVEVAGGKMQFL